MRCIDKRIFICILCLVLMMPLVACGNTKYDLPYKRNNESSSLSLAGQNTLKQLATPFASELCISTSDKGNAEVDLAEISAAGLFDLNKKKTIYAKGLNHVLHPASLTKVMTALVAMKNCPLEDVLTATENVKITEAGAQLCGLNPGDRMTLDQALHVLLIYSANDVAMMIAEHVGGTVENFVNMMNEELLALGATNSHFMNPNGLTEEDHYVTAYDMYLIFNEAIQYSAFTEIIQMSTYDTVYYDGNGVEKELKVENTNLYKKGNYESPSGVTVIGGKTGTTNAAGHCIILYVKDTAGSPYISIMMNATSRDSLYGKMSDLLQEVQP